MVWLATSYLTLTNTYREIEAKMFLCFRNIVQNQVKKMRLLILLTLGFSNALLKPGGNVIKTQEIGTKQLITETNQEKKDNFFFHGWYFVQI